MDDQSTPAAEPVPGPGRESPRRISRRSATIVLIGIVIAALVAWQLGKTAQTHASGNRRGRPATTVALAVAQRGDVPITVDALGTVTPLSTATVRPLVSGDLKRVTFREGDIVRAGQVLAEVDPRPYQLALQQAQGQLARDRALLENARLTLGRYRTLLAQDSIARQDVDTQAATAKQLAGTVATDQAAVGTARLNLSYTRITAPVTGRIGLRKVDVGNYVSAGDANGVAVITVVAPIDVAFSVPQDLVDAFMARQRAGGPIAVSALDRTRQSELAQGTFLTLDNQVDVTTGTVKAKARFANQDGQLFPNQFVNVRILLNTVDNAIVVPAAAVRHGSKGDFVFVVGDDRIAHVRMVRLGPSHGETQSIVSGLQVGEKVVTEGGDRLEDGGRVMLPGDRPQGRWGQRRKAGGLFGWLFGKKDGAGQDGGAPASGRQTGQAQGGGGPGRGDRTARLIQGLGLDAQQTARAEALFAQARRQAGDDPDARRQAMRQAMDQLEPILRPDQKQKLQQMRQRMSGGRPEGEPGGGG